MDGTPSAFAPPSKVSAITLSVTGSRATSWPLNAAGTVQLAASARGSVSSSPGELVHPDIRTPAHRSTTSTCARTIRPTPVS